MKNNSIYITRPSLPLIGEYLDQLKEIWKSQWLTNMGPKHDEFQKLLKVYLGVDNLELLVNGHMALEMTLQAMDMEGEVITTPFTFASTTHAIVRNGLTPVFCDIDPVNYTIDVNRIEDLITDKTCAILPVHVYGNMCEVDEIHRIANRHGLKVIYDAAHAFGELYNGKGVGMYGDASIFSFHATKVFNTVEGGAVCYRDERIGQLLYDLKNFGIHSEEEVAGIGANAKMNELCAAMGICNLRHVDEDIAKRRMVDQRYRERLSEVSGLRLNEEQVGLERNYAYFPVVVDPDIYGESRDEIARRLRNEGIYARKYFYPLTSAFSAYSGRFDPDETPVAKRISERVLTLPIYPDLALDDVDRVCEVMLGN